MGCACLWLNALTPKVLGYFISKFVHSKMVEPAHNAAEYFCSECDVVGWG